MDGSRFLEEVSGPAAPAAIRIIGKVTVRVASTAARVRALDPGPRSNLLFEATAGFLGSVSSEPGKK